MNIPPSEHPDSIFCPSCAARIETADRTSGETLRCPVCGTEFKYAPSQTAESAIAESDRPNIALPNAASPNVTSNADPPTRRFSTEEILLERLKNEPPHKQPIRWSSFALLVAVVLAVTYGIFRIASKPDKFAPGEGVDSTALLQKRMFFQHVIDSLQTEIAANPANLDLHLSLADALYDAAQWGESVKQFQIYLAARPADADARVDYAYTIAQNSGNINDALAEIDTALHYKPNFLNALVNAGILTAQTVTDSNHATALARARDYFVRAKAVAEKTDPGIAARIDTLIQEIDNTGQRTAKP